MGQDNKTILSSLQSAADIVAAYVSNNSLQAADLPDLIATVHASLRQISSGASRPQEPQDLAPAVPIKKSVTKDYVVCLEDGKQFKSLRRHLNTHHNLTPEQYRAKWGLPRDHPIVAPSYSATRSQLAKDSGLGLLGDDTAGKGAGSSDKKSGRGRPKKSSAG